MKMNIRQNISTQRYVLLAIALAVVVTGYGLYEYAASRAALPEGLIQANGRIEGDAVAIASKVAGKIVGIEVREGDAVKAGQLLVRLDDAQLRARVAQAAAATATLESQGASARLGIDLLTKEVPLTVDASRAGIGRAQAAVAKAEATERQARRDADRARDLVAKGFVSGQQSERTQLALDAAASEVTSAVETLVQSRKQHAQAELGAVRIRAKEAEYLALQAQLRQTQAALAEAESVLADLTIRAPAAGVVATRIREPGEVVSAGAPLLELVDLDQLYLKVYVAEAQIGKLRLGLPAHVYTDAFPDQPFEAIVRHISSRAEFTPKEVQTPDERVKLVFAVKLYINSNPDHRLTPGLPADAVIRWKEEVKWMKPRW
ncbi:MAG: HlyD family efflux transporter periplasmic adaptor subunit [Betaproteobacteria bacterium]|nr:HlyD family efflux transporter periplasmic adaptor subunit [Betaproteobacteria bacterium]